jgi:ribosomal protein L4
VTRDCPVVDKSLCKVIASVHNFILNNRRQGTRRRDKTKNHVDGGKTEGLRTRKMM